MKAIFIACTLSTLAKLLLFVPFTHESGICHAAIKQMLAIYSLKKFDKIHWKLGTVDKEWCAIHGCKVYLVFGSFEVTYMGH